MRFEQQPETVVCQWLRRVSCIREDKVLLDVKHTKCRTRRGSALLL